MLCVALGQQMAITQTLNFVGMRMYGGHVFVAGGVVSE